MEGHATTGSIDPGGSRLEGPGRPRRHRPAGGILALLVLALVAGGVMFVGVQLRPRGVPPSPRPTGSRLVAASASSPAATRTAGVPVASATSIAASTASPPAARFALVPIVSFWSPERSIARTDLARIASGADSRRHAVVAAADVRAAAGSLGVAPAAIRSAGDAAQVRATVRDDEAAVGIVRASDVTPDVRALAIDGVALFGATRIHALEEWPLLAPSATPDAFAADALWTLAAGGDVMLDRDAYPAITGSGRGADFPWDGGTAAISGPACCGFGGARLVAGTRSSASPSVRSILTSADVAAVNLEAPVPDAFTHHAAGLVFDTDRSLLPGLRRAGIDVVSLANNHMGNAGAAGIVQTPGNLDAAGIGHVGAGGTLASAGEPWWTDAAGTRIAVLADDDVWPGDWAAASRPGTAPLRIDRVAGDIAAARAAGAQVVIVMPHWGIEYTDAVSAAEATEARALAAAGADVILGSHSHWTGPIQSIATERGTTLVIYSLGDFVFDLVHDERTQEGVIADLTFSGTRLVQIELHPTLILDAAQPNLLDPARDGARVLEAIRAASNALAP